ncbi:C4-dicarboxylate TRAP transporter substrate-binding protein [Ectothiorhodospiraceae bacterium WFHF3C12]|nr:C4-dicarboxylate TRAP transporter substrate-binding protein [Ectothiorhodospiraceae bacterium WFHF3C12]
MKYTRSFLRVALSGLIGAGALLGSAASAEELRYAMGMPPGSISAQIGEDYAEAVKEYSDGEVTVKVYPLSLLNFAETSAGVRDGIADIGYLLAPYFPSEYPHFNMIAEASMVLTLMGEEVRGREGMAYVGAMSEFVFFDCPECNQDFADQNQVFTGSTGSSPYILQCTEPVTTIEDVKGKRLRVGAASWSRWAEDIGAVPVTMSANEMLEALDQGVVDCIVLSVPEIRNFGLGDTVTDITRVVPGGIFAGTAVTNFNRDTWQSLNDNERAALLRAGAITSAATPWEYHKRHETILAEMEQEGAEVHDPDPALVEEIRAFTREDMETIAENYSDKHGVERGEEMIARFRELLDKWVGLVQDVDSRQELVDLYWEEIFSRVDPATHGM